MTVAGFSIPASRPAETRLGALARGALPLLVAAALGALAALPRSCTASPVGLLHAATLAALPF